MAQEKRLLLDKAREVLEWPALLSRLAERATSALGANACKSIPLASTIEAVKRSNAETSEMKVLLEDGGSVPIGAFEDLRPIIERAEKGAIIDPGDLAFVSSMLELARLLRGFFKNQREQCPLLWECASSLDEASELKREIDGAIDAKGNLKESASPELKRLTQSVRDRRRSILARLEEYMLSDEVAPFLMDEFYTQRGSRYVLPVKAEFRARVEGIVHDSSNSGQTFFIEPRSFINANNDLKMAEMEVAQEAQRILKELGEKVGASAQALRINLEILTELDIIYAKARLSLDLNAVEPLIQISNGYPTFNEGGVPTKNRGPGGINDRGTINLKAARHPLLALSGDVVPNDIEFSGELSALVISGPNTGGKTVTLKTIGLFALMVRAGIHIPAEDGSEMAIFPEVFADIGDEQDIGRHLSTFSGHILNIIGILDAASRGALALLDELVTSTDPAEGSALAEAVLNRLTELGAKIIATTHYAQLKAYAQAHPRFANASVEFDNETLTPTYRLIMGIPGRSSALETAQRLGMAPVVINRAKELLGAADRRIEDMLVSLEKQKRDLIAETLEAAKQKETARSMAEEGERIRAELAAKEREFRSSLRSRLQSETEAARRKIHDIMQSLTKERTRKQAIEARKKLGEIEKHYREGILIEGEKADPASLKSGAQVVIAHLGVVGVLMEDVAASPPFIPPLAGGQRGDSFRDDAPGAPARPGPQVDGVTPILKQKVKVRIGRAPMVVPTDSLRIVPASFPQPADALGKTHSPRDAPQEEIEYPGKRLDLRGYRADDAIDEVQRLLDRAALAHINELEIIHGHGTGALKKVIREFLTGSPYVQQWRPADLRGGGDGVTIVTLKP